MVVVAVDLWLWSVFCYSAAEFNRPSQKLQEQIDNQEQRRVDMAHRLDSARKQIADIEARQVQLESEMEAMEQQRQESLPEANKRLMIHIPDGPFTMGGATRNIRAANDQRTPFFSLITTYRVIQRLTKITGSLFSAPVIASPYTGSVERFPPGWLSIRSSTCRGRTQPLSQRGAALACLQKLNGRRPREGRTNAPIRGGRVLRRANVVTAVEP